MNELWYRIRTRSSYFIWFLVVVSIVLFFLWRVIDPVGSATIVNGLLADIWTFIKTIITYVLAIAFTIVGIRMMFGIKPGKKKQ